jgi:azurin
MIHRIAAAAAAGLLNLGLAAAPAFAGSAPDPSTTVAVDDDQVTITTDLATVQRLCSRAITTLVHLDDLQARLTGDATVLGSIARAQASQEAAEAAGATTTADWWQLVVDRREGYLPLVENAQSRLQTGYDTVCTQIPGVTP